MKPLNTFLLGIAFLLPMAAQQPAAAPAPREEKKDAKADAKPDAKPDAKVDVKSPAAPAPESPVPSSESWLTGSIDLGYRWNTGVGGSMDTYRSIINLGSGPKLLGADFTIADPQHRFFDQIHVRAYGWGGEPYSTFHLDAKKAKLYDFRADYRDIAYFNVLPSYADPLLSRGIVLDEQSFDTRRRFTSFALDLLPGGRIIPYFAFDRDSNSGRGATTFVSDSNEYPVPNTLRDSTNLYRGGVRLEFRRFHATLEEGGTTFKDDQRVFQTSGINFGNTTSTISGQRLDLTNLLAAYGIRGNSTYTKALFTASPTSWLDFYGQFLYSEPQTDVHFQQTDAGNLFLQSQFVFYTSQQYLLSSSAKLPHTSASAGAEIRPMRRVRIIESWLTDRLHNSSGAGSTQILAGSGTSQQLTALLASTLATNYNQNEIDLYFDATSKLMLRGGYRYVWGDGNQTILPAAELSSSVQGNFSRNVGLGGLTFRPSQKISLTAEAEAAAGDGAYFRTSLYNYQKVRAQARYQATNSLSLSGDFSVLTNQNPLAGTKYDFSSYQESLSLVWAPGGGKSWDFQGSYSRYDLKSDISYLVPQDLTQQVDHYRERAHTVTGLFDLNAPHIWGRAPKFTAGGSFFISSGSRPTNYFQPLARLSVPINKHVSWFSEWRYYGYGEALYLYEGFRSHLVTTGLRFMR
ncbi:MAG TPA: hypothetical protein VNX18_12165 [Bryobacteraceae bacterium]|nr:hypothetical protein [Bryobacteraceae bacterium]